MTNEIIEFLTTNRVGVVAILINGAPHSATVHFSVQTDPLEIYFATSIKSKKCQPLLTDESVPASFVVGFNENDCITFQADGLAMLVTNQIERAAIVDIHYAKFLDHSKHRDNHDTAIVKLLPRWYRYSDFNHKPPKITGNQN